MNKIAKILMERDDLSQTEAIEIVEEARAAILECDGSYMAACDILMYDLGLEPDYLMDLIM